MIMSREEKRIARTGWLEDNSPEISRKSKKLTHKRVRKHNQKYLNLMEYNNE